MKAQMAAKPAKSQGVKTQKLREPHQDDDEHEGNGDKEDQQAIEIGQIAPGGDGGVGGIRFKA